MPYKEDKQRLEYNKKYYKENKNKAKQYYTENKEKYRDRNTQIRQRNKQFLDEYKLQKGCKNCGFNSHACSLDFHHIDDKTENVSRLSKNCNSIKKLTEEVNKCIILCANCHRIKHYGDMA